MNNKQIDSEIKRIRAQTRKKNSEIKSRSEEYYKRKGIKNPRTHKATQLEVYNNRQQKRINDLLKQKEINSFVRKNSKKLKRIPKTRSEFAQNIITHGILEYQLENYSEYTKVMRQAQAVLLPGDVYTLQISALFNEAEGISRKAMKIDEAVYPVMLILSEEEFDSILDDAKNNNINRNDDFSNSDEDIKNSEFRLPGVLISFRAQELKRPNRRNGNTRTSRNAFRNNSSNADYGELSLYGMEI